MRAVASPSQDIRLARRLSARVRLRDGVRLEVSAEQISLLSDGRSTTLRGVPPLVRDALVALATPDGLTPEQLSRADIGGGLSRLLSRLGHLTTTMLVAGHRPVMGHEAMVRDGAYTPVVPRDRSLVRLDRFAVLRTRRDALVLESARSLHRFVLLAASARRLTGELAMPQHVDDLSPKAQNPDAGLERDVLAHFVGAGLVEVAGRDGKFASDTDPELVPWEFHDMLMHSRSRSGRFDEPLGALSPYRGTLDPLPAVVPPRQSPLLRAVLPRASGTARALRLGEALEQRRSIRDYDARPVTVAELGELLHRAFRTRARFDPDDPVEESKISRPYPSGGGLYEHELYLTVRRCSCLASGIYRYDGLAHVLELVNADPRDAREMLAVAAAATGHPAEPDVLLTLTARFARMSWRYRSIAYANTLRTTGAIYQTLYLVATDLDLAPCGLGNGDSDLTARVLGLDSLQESSVGDFILGRRRPDDVVTGGEPPPGWTLLDTPGESW